MATTGLADGPPEASVSASPEEFKQAVSAFPTGVVVVSTIDEREKPVGFTSNAFASVSMTPPLVGLFVARSSRTLRSLRRSDVFAVNFLNVSAEHVAARFASPADDKFQAVDWVPGIGGVPLLRSASLAIVECEKFDLIPTGDHELLLGRVVRATRNQDEEPIVYYEREYMTLPHPRYGSEVSA
ncbi:NADH-FMN oxidoreductase RutF, flavin reductase (DIM6/NTAB) family [Pseudonocardia thermophila]|uniref:NADH-FMN oxidoreductase RutF, flavin reductase (DIM6/NTAB) family n=1 Tax=Pseudonocardia thermophila TaxID=1848 RepID=A0A1M7BFV5_PSETH|nr:flavin reductase family protein [Pseudonocardia thermophila]SHL53827.1 NADH-FMN oxidoreductase RutF, flavin reductase (DIM6/NTAB) family [Pseudonocardia thermophila]